MLKYSINPFFVDRAPFLYNEFQESKFKFLSLKV